MSTISPCLWFDGKAEEAAGFYVSLLPDSGIDTVSRYPQDGPSWKAGQAMLVEFTLAGQPYKALNGGPMYQHTPAISLMVGCADQAEVDRLWDALAEGGQPLRCGWITDRFGVTWQVVPDELAAVMRQPDPDRKARVMNAFMGMTKLDMATLRQAAEG